MGARDGYRGLPRLVAPGTLIALAGVVVVTACAGLPAPVPPVGAVVVTAGGEALTDGVSDVPPTLDLRLRAARPLHPEEASAQLDGAPLALRRDGDGSLAGSVAPLPLGSAHTLRLAVAGRQRQVIPFRVVAPVAAVAALHDDAGGGVALDLAFALAPEPEGVEAAVPGGRRQWIDDRHLRVTWPSAPGGRLRLPLRLPTARGSHLAAPLDLDLGPVAPGTARTAIVPPSPAVSGHPLMVAFSVATAASRASLAAHAASLSAVSPAGVEVAADGSLVGAPDAAAVAVATARGLPVWPLVQNQGFDADATHRLLGDPRAVDRLVAGLRALAARPGFGGVQLDVEGMRREDRDGFSALVRRLATALAAEGHQLVVDVLPQLPGHLGLAAQAYDLAAIAAVAPWVMVMAYEEHGDGTAPGPVAGLDWVEAAVTASLARLRPDRTLLGMAAYCRTWSSAGVDAADEPTALASALATPGARVDLDPAAMTLVVRAPDGAVTYLQDGSLLARTVTVANAHGLAGAALWRLGFEDPTLWSLLPAPRRV